MDDFEHHMTKCLKAVLSLTFSGVIIEKCALNNLLCYYTKNDDSAKVRDGRSMSPQSQRNSYD